jgi:predicted nucleotide-binding protein
MDTRTEQAIAVLEKHLNRIFPLRRCQPYSSEHVRWLQNVDLDLARLFTTTSGIYHNWKAISWQFTGTFIASAWEKEVVERSKNLEAYQWGLDMAEGIIESAIDQLEQVGIQGIEDEQGYITPSMNKRIFISHGKHTPALDRVERFIRALGFVPVIVAREPSLGKSVDDLVEEQMTGCLCAIILATKDDKVQDYFQPRPNVIHEIGLAQEKFRNRVIYLKEEGCEFPSNVQPKVWEDFTQESLENVFEKIVKELRGFKLLG